MTKKQDIMRNMQRRIENGDYQPGQRLPGVAEVCAEFRVSTATAVYAMRALADEGYAVAKHGTGYFVALDLPFTQGKRRLSYIERELRAEAARLIELADQLVAINQSQDNESSGTETMDSLNNLIDRAANVGRYAAGLAGDTDLIGDAHHPGDDTGRLVLEAYREYGAEAVRSVVAAYQFAYNEHAKEHGGQLIEQIHIKNGIGWSLAGATDAELEEIPAAL